MSGIPDAVAARRAASQHDDNWHCARCCRRRQCNAVAHLVLGGVRWPRLCEECTVALVAWQARDTLRAAGVDARAPCGVPGCLTPRHTSCGGRFGSATCWDHMPPETRRKTADRERDFVREIGRRA